MNILIVDDDRYVVASLEHNINWPSLGFEKVFTANNMNQAKKIITEESVQILISDIEMPQGSGLDLLSWIGAERYDIQTIFLTNYADFSYAKRAIELQSFEYHLKPIEFDKLMLIILKAIKKVETVQKMKEAESFAHLWEVNKINFSELFWVSYLKHGENYTSNELKTHLKNNYLPYNSNNQFLIILFEFFSYTLSDNNELSSCFGHEKNQTTVIKTNFNINFSKIISQNDILVESSSIGNQFIAIINCSDHQYSNLISTLKDSCYQFIDIMRFQFNCPITCNIGLPCTFNTFHTTLKRLQLMNEDIIDCRNQVFTLHNYVPILAEYSLPNLDFLDKQLHAGDCNTFVKTCRDYLTSLARSKELNRNVISNFQIDITQLIYSFLKENEVLAHKLLQGKTNELLLEYSTKSIEDMIIYINYLINVSMDYIKFTTSQKSVVTIICDYIDTHYAEDINRSSLSEIVYLNPDYTSRLFKKETGTSLGNYIIQKRITVAKDLLLHTDFPVNLISDKVGYGNYSYFTKLFRKETNYTPIDYRRIMRR